MKKIESAKNDNMKRWRSLLTSRGLKKTGQFLWAGQKLVPEALKNHKNTFIEILYPEGTETRLENASALTAYALTPELFRELDTFGTKHPILVGRVPKIPTADLTAPPNGLEILCCVGDPANLGVLLRNAEAFAASRVVLLSNAAHPFHPKCIRASSGSVLRVPMAYGPALEDINGDVVALDPNGESIFEWQWPKDVRIVMGEEGPGLPAGLKVAHRVRIPTASGLESLNAVTATTLAMFSYRSQWS